MTITYVGAGTAATGNNTSVTPVAHASTTTGDLVVVHASIRNSGTGTVNTPTGWTLVAGTANQVVLAKIWDGTAIPAITFTGGVANADTIAQTTTFRGVEKQLPDAIGSTTTQLNGSSQNIAMPALDVPGAAHLVMVFTWKQDDLTTISSPGGFNAVGVTNSTAGDDAGQATFYAIETTEYDPPSETLTVTGGASAISRVILASFRPAATLTITTQNVYPPRVLVELTGLTIGDSVTFYRSVDGILTALRAGADDAVSDTSFLVVDSELPFGVPVTYVGKVGAVTYTSAAVTYTLPGGQVAVTDAITGLAAELVILAWDSLDYDRQATIFKVAARNIVVSGPLGQAEADITFYTETRTASEDLFALLTDATEGVVQIRQPGGYDDVDGWYSITSVKKTRFSQDGSDPRRTWIVHAVQVDGWAPALEARGFTLQDIYDFYGATGTLTDLSGDYATLLALAEADFS